MNTTIVGKQLELTDSIKSYIDGAFETFLKYDLDIISLRCVISADEKNGKKGFVVDLSLNVAKRGTIVINQKDKDLYAAIDLAADRTNKVLRREHDKIVSSKHKDHKEQINEYMNSSDEEDRVEVIIPTELETYKPLEIDEAIEKLKNSKDIFLVFNDNEAKMRVLYKTKNGQFGLY